ncbi:MAG: hypothetical protein LBC67_02390, partial [Spirochaetales bacterium]|nr:hypothetical protein [Spirochaetales bacterium]
GSGGGDDEELLKVNHVTGFQGKLTGGSLLEIEVPSTADGTRTFTIYVNGENKGTGTLAISGGVITALTCTGGSLTFSSNGVVTYSGSQIQLRLADDKVWVHWGAYYGGTMNHFNSFAAQYNRDADMMYAYHPNPNDQGYYFGYPGNPSYENPEIIYGTACVDHPADRPPIGVLNDAIRVLNNHRNTGVGAYVSRGNLIAYYFRRVQ